MEENMLSKYFHLTEWKIYMLILAILGLTILVFGFLGPYLISAKCTYSVLLGLGVIFVVYPFVVFIFGKPLFSKLRRIL